MMEFLQFYVSSFWGLGRDYIRGVGDSLQHMAQIDGAQRAEKRHEMNPFPEYVQQELRALFSDQWQGCAALGMSQSCASMLAYYGIAETRQITRPNGVVVHQYRVLNCHQPQSDYGETT
jgi:hypothetical protein